jgi:type IV pilus assembly protein PilC
MADSNLKPRRFRIRPKDREYFSSNLSLLVKAAMPLGDALQSLHDTTSSHTLRKALEQMRRDIDEGMPLWQALERSGAVSRQTLELVRLGEQSGNLTANLLVAAKQEQKQRTFRAKVRSALIYPAFVLSLTVLVGFGVAWFLLPRLAATFTDLGVELPLLSRILIDAGLFLRENGIWFIPSVVFGGMAFCYIMFAAPKTRNIGLLLLFHTPGVGRLLREVEVARFGYLLGAMLQAGLTVTRALQLVHSATTAAQYRELYKYLHDSLDNGFSFGASLPKYKKAGKLMPPSVQQMIIAGERSGALPETLTSIGSIYEEKADTSVRNLEAILEPVLLVIVWLGVMGVAISVIVPIYNLIGGLGG